MYHEILHVLVFTKDESLAAILREVPALEHFEHVFHQIFPLWTVRMRTW